MDNIFNNSHKGQDLTGNFFDITIPDVSKESINNSPFAQNPSDLNFGGANSLLKIKPPEKIPTLGDILDKFLETFFPKLYKIRVMKKALNKLDKLNETVVELMSKNSGVSKENNRYKILSTYINKANMIHSRLKKKI